MSTFNPLTLPRVNSEYGAPMGRHGQLHPANEAKVRVSRVRLDRGGYDSGGAYWGLGKPLYWVRSDDGAVNEFFRAWDREGAKEKALAVNPDLKFFR